MEFWDALTSRRNVRSYTGEPIAPDQLDRILEAGRRTPSASNRQHWDLVVVTDQQQLTELGEVWMGARHIPGSAATVALVVPVPDDERMKTTDLYDLGQLTYGIMLAAADLGIGSGHSSIGDQDRARKILGVPETHLVSYLIGLGHPADRPLAPIVNPDRRPLDDVVHRGHW